jgi:hypothetical protein
MSSVISLLSEEAILKIEEFAISDDFSDAFKFMENNNIFNNNMLDNNSKERIIEYLKDIIIIIKEVKSFNICNICETDFALQNKNYDIIDTILYLCDLNKKRPINESDLQQRKKNY